jgi:hypothetical protein
LAVAQHDGLKRQLAAEEARDLHAEIQSMAVSIRHNRDAFGATASY